jgi:L,D-peptidoglycan transpeptidase YkuD (ErfK/YbiS/YcfS/YnhG family)
MTRGAGRCAAVLAVAAALPALSGNAVAQSCPEPLASARRLVLVTADGMATSKARLRLYERAAPGAALQSAAQGAAWRPVGGVAPAIIGRNGLGWSFAFRQLAARGEPVKVDGDKRAPAGIYRLGATFGLAPSRRANYLHLTEGTVCVDDPASPAYNTITARAKVGWKVHGENMWRIPHYRHGMVVDYPTDRRRHGGSCIFIHLKMPQATSTSGCVALEEPALLALQEFAAPGAVLAILPAQATSRLGACLPQHR